MTFNTQGSTEECVVVMLVDDELDEPDEWLLIRINGQTGDYSDFQAIVNISISGGPNGGGTVGMSWHVSFFFECIYRCCTNKHSSQLQQKNIMLLALPLLYFLCMVPFNNRS